MSSLPPRPKPWETKQGEASSSTPNHAPPPAPSAPSAFDTAIASSSATAPQIPERPAELATTSNSLTSPYGAGSYGSRYGGGYGGVGGMGGMGGMGYGGYSSMNRLGGYGGMGSYGSYGSYGMGGGYGSAYGMPGYGVGGMAAPGEMNPSLTSSLQATTAPAFAVLESLVMAFTSMAQLVESTYMATHSSFFAMIGVADQLGSIKTYLGQVLGVFSILRLGRKLVAWLRGSRTKTEGWVREWAGAAPGSLLPPPGSSPDNVPRPSVKPLILFLLSAVGLPYLMTRLVKLLIAQQQQQQQQLANGVDGNIDPTKLTFARAKFEFKGNDEWELQLARDEIVAVLEMREPVKAGDTAGWWRGRTRDGRIGWFPGNYVEVIRRRE